MAARVPPTDEQMAAAKPWAYRALAAIVVGLLSYAALVAYWVTSSEPDRRIAATWFIGTWWTVRFVETICLRRMERIAPGPLPIPWRRYWFHFATMFVILVLLGIVFLNV